MQTVDGSGQPQQSASRGIGFCSSPRSSSALALLALLLVACGEDPIGPQLGTIRITTQTTGGDLDSDGYEIVTGAGARWSIGVNATAEITGISAGVHTVVLERVSDNCEAGGPQPRSVTVPADGSAEVVFQVVCATTGLEITTRSTGADIPSSYPLYVDGIPVGSISANGSVVVSRLAPGRHTVALTVPSPRCAAGGSPSEAEVVNRSVMPVLLEVACLQRAPWERPEKIAYVFDSTESGGLWIGLLDLELLKTTTLTRGQSPDWSPDGTRLVFSDDGALVVIDPETGDRSTLNTAGPSFEPAWAPTGDVIAFVRWNEPAPRFERLYVLKLDGSAPVEIVTPGVAWVESPAWSPDGQRIAFTCHVSSLKNDVCIINRDGTGFLRLTSDPYRYSQPAWSPDGRRIALCRETPWDIGCDIALLGADGSGLTTLTIGFSPAWSPDGSKLVFARGGDGLFTINVDGTNLMRLTTGRHWEPAWQPGDPADPCPGCWDY